MRTPLSRASAITSATVVVGAATPLGIRSRMVIRSRTSTMRLLCMTHEIAAGWPTVVRLARARLRFSTGSRQFFGHRAQLVVCHVASGAAAQDPRRDAQREPQVRIGQVPAAQRLQPADPVRDGVAVDAEPCRRLSEAAAARARPGASAAAPAGRLGRPTRTGASSSRAWRGPSGRLRRLPSSRYAGSRDARPTTGGSSSASSASSVARAAASAAGRAPGSSNGRDTATARARNDAIRPAIARPSGSSAGAAATIRSSRLSARAAQRQPPRRHEQPQLGACLLAGGDVVRPVGGRLAGQDHDPRRAVGRQRVAARVSSRAWRTASSRASSSASSAAIRAAAIRSSSFGGSSPSSTSRPAAHRARRPGRGSRRGARPRTAWRGSASRPRRRRAARRARGRRSGRRGGPRWRRPAPGTPPIAAARPSSPRPSSASLVELALEVGRLALQLGPVVHEEADDAPLERGRVGPADAQHGQPGRRPRPRRAPRRDSAAAVAVDEDDRRHARPRQRRGELVDLRPVRGDDREGGAGDDREVAAPRAHRTPGRGPSAPGPSRPRARRGPGRAPWTLPVGPAGRSSGRGHAGWPSARRAASGRGGCVGGRAAAGSPGRRTATRSSSSRPNSRSTST